MNYEENKLELIVRESGLETSKAQYILDTFQDYFKIAAEWEIKAKAIVVTDESQKTEMQMARVGRLFLKEKRIDIEKARKSLKEQALREGKAIDGIANVFKALIVPIEEYLMRQEKFVELKKEAEEKRLQLEAERKAEEERIAKEKAEAEERERIRLENERLKKEAEEKEAIHRAELAAAEAKQREVEEKARVEREKIEAEAKAEKIKAERAKAETDAKLKAIESERLAEKSKEVECPFCHKRFVPEATNLRTNHGSLY